MKNQNCIKQDGMIKDMLPAIYVINKIINIIYVKP